MDRTRTWTALLLGVAIALPCTWADQAGQTSDCNKPIVGQEAVDRVLSELRGAAVALQSYHAQIEMVFTQPALETQTIRKGVLFYAKFGKKSKLRLDFTTLQIDDGKPKKYVEERAFDGVWLTQIDHQIRSAEVRQLLEPNQPVDAFDLASRNMPLVGFAKTEGLKKQFDITLVSDPQPRGEPWIRLRLKTKPDSVYRNDYTLIDFWVDKKLKLPAKIMAFTTEADVYEIRLLKPQVNAKIDPKTFDLAIPEGFSTRRIPLKKPVEP